MDLWCNDFSTIEDVQMIDLTSERVEGGLRGTDVGMGTRAVYFRDENLTLSFYPVGQMILGSFCRSQT